MSADAKTAGSDGPSPQDYKTYVDALAMTRDAVLLLDQELPITVESSIHDELEAELLSVERERLALKERFRAYQKDSSGFTPPDQQTINKITTLSTQVDGLNADQAQAEAILKVASDIADTAAKVFGAK